MNLQKTLVVAGALCLMSINLIAQQSTGWKMLPVNIQSRWAAQVSPENALKESPRAGFGFGDMVNPQTMIRQYAVMTDTLVKLRGMGLSGSIYTQPFDADGEQNGLMSYDREIIKMPITELSKSNGRLWPVTRNYATTTAGFSATVADTLIKDYATRLKEYRNGKRDSIFLRNLALMADKEKDIDNAVKISRDYITGLKDPLLLPNLEFIQKFTNSSKDPGFDFMLNNLDRIALVTSPKSYKNKVETIIFREQVKHLLNESPDWNKVDQVIKKYKTIDGEMIIGNSVVTYLVATSEGKKNGTRNVVAAATLYDDRYHGGKYNDWAWLLFKKSTDTAELNKALEWGKKEIDRTPKNNDRYGGDLDTYANILYKLGRKEEALSWQEKAIQASPKDEQIKGAYEKMKKGISTWGE